MYGQISGTIKCAQTTTGKLNCMWPTKTTQLPQVTSNIIDSA